MRAAATDDELPEDLRKRLSSVDPDGVQLTSIIVARLRFERLIQGSNRARAWFEEDPRAFTKAFKRYHTTVAARATFPSQEARAFEAWLDNAGEPPPR